MSSKQFILECIFDVPTDPFEQADALTLIKKPWAALTDGLKTLGVPFEQRTELVEPRSEPRPASGLTRLGKPRKKPGRQPGYTNKPTQPIQPLPQPVSAFSDMDDEDVEAAE